MRWFFLGPRASLGSLGCGFVGIRALALSLGLRRRVRALGVLAFGSSQCLRDLILFWGCLNCGVAGRAGFPDRYGALGHLGLERRLSGLHAGSMKAISDET